MRFKVGFFTAKHPEIDDVEPGTCYAFLQTFTLNAKDRTEAASKAKARADVNLLKAELTRRWPRAKSVNYTMQHMSKKAGRTWGRSFLPWKLIDQSDTVPDVHKCPGCGENRRDRLFIECETCGTLGSLLSER